MSVAFEHHPESELAALARRAEARLAKTAEAIIHPQACVGDAKIGARTHVWQFASVIRGSAIGADCTIGSTAIVDGARMGDGCSIGHGAQLHPGTWLGDKVFVGPGAIVCNDLWPSMSKQGFDLDALLAGELVTVRIEDGAVIGAGALILPGVTVEAGAFVAAGAVVTRPVLSGHLWHRTGDMVRAETFRPFKRTPRAPC